MFLDITDIGEVIASRSLSLGERDEITIHIGRPFAPPDYGGNFCCPYQIRGIGDEKIRYGSGVDSLQALYLAMINISTDLYPTKEARDGRIRWQGDRDLGLPVAETIRDFLQDRTE